MSEETPVRTPPNKPLPAASDRSSVLEVLERLTGAATYVELREATTIDARREPAAGSERARVRSRTSYRVLGEIARGGMGVVMRVRDDDLGRDLALKVLHRELGSRPDAVQRFVEEAQISGQLQHPGVVPVYELGLLADERPYFAMKLVKGRTLAELLAAHPDAAHERRKLLDVYESVCQTIAYAHSRGVVHRDLKPANVMVGAFGEVQVVDWGLAKVLQPRRAQSARDPESSTSFVLLETIQRAREASSHSHSIAGRVMGTPAYMSPEQARGETDKLDERSDVFSLGAILCEILTGKPPYATSPDETVHHAAKAELNDATARLDACGADVELVVLCKQCLAPAQDLRPRSAEVLAERVHAYVSSVEERARQAQIDAAEARVRSREERHARKLTIALASSVLLTIVLGGAGWLWFEQQRARRQEVVEQAVQAELTAATLARGRSDWNAARAAIERAQARLDTSEVDSPLRSRVTAEAQTIASESSAAERVTDLAHDNERLLAELRDVRRPEGSFSYTTDWTRLDGDYRALFERHGLRIDDGAEASAAESLLARGIAPELAAGLDEWSLVRRSAKHDDGAARLARVADRIDGDDERRLVRAAVAAGDVAKLESFAASPDLRQQPAATLRLLALGLARGGEREQSIAVLRLARREYPGDFVLAMELGRALARGNKSDAQEAALHYSVALGLRPESVEARHELGMTLEQKLGQPAEGLDHFRAALGRQPDDAHLHFHAARALLALGRLPESVSENRRAIELDPDDAKSHNNLGAALERSGDLASAVASYRRAVELDPQDSGAHHNLALALERLGDYPAAIAAYRRIVDEVEPNNADRLNSLGWLLATCERAELRDPDEAVRCMRRAIALAPNDGYSWNTLGIALYRQGNLDECARALRRSMELRAGGDYYDWLFLAMAEQRLGHADAAQQSYAKALDWLAKQPTPPADFASFRAEAEGVLAAK